MKLELKDDSWKTRVNGWYSKLVQDWCAELRDPLYFHQITLRPSEIEKNSTVPARLFVTGIGSGADIGLLRKFAIPEKNRILSQRYAREAHELLFFGGFYAATDGKFWGFPTHYTQKTPL